MPALLPFVLTVAIYRGLTFITGAILLNAIFGMLSDLFFLGALVLLMPKLGKGGRMLSSWLLAVAACWTFVSTRYLASTGFVLTNKTIRAFVFGAGTEAVAIATIDIVDVLILIAVFGSTLWLGLRRINVKPSPLSKRARLSAILLLIGSILLPNPRSRAASYTPALAPIMSSFAKTLNEEFSELVNGEALPISTTVVLSQADEKPLPNSNIVLILLESTGLHGTSLHASGDPSWTPFLLSLAKGGVELSNAHAIVPHTSKALLSLWCGVYPSVSITMRESEPDNDFDKLCLPRILADRGYRTAHFQSATEAFENRRILTERAGFHETFTAEDYSNEGFSKANYFGYEDRVMLAPISNWLNADSTSPLFLTVLTNTPHHDYRWLPSYGSAKRAATATEKEKWQQAVHYTDAVAKEIHSMVMETGRETIFIVMGDHGEAFGEHGRHFHDTIPWNEGIRIPWVMSFPDRRHQKITGLVSQLDFLPTILDELHISYDAASAAGSSVFRTQPGRHLFGACIDFGCAFAVGEEGKFIHHLGNASNEFFLRGDELELTNRLEDSQWRPQVSTMRESLARWFLGMRQRPGESQ